MKSMIKRKILLKQLLLSTILLPTVTLLSVDIECWYNKRLGPNNSQDVDVPPLCAIATAPDGYGWDCVGSEYQIEECCCLVGSMEVDWNPGNWIYPPNQPRYCEGSWLLEKRTRHDRYCYEPVP